MNNYDELNFIIKDKKILYIPIYSCFDYKTSQLNFKADGNINRFLSTFYHCNSYKKLTIVCPINGNDFNWFRNICEHELLKNTNLYYSEHIQKSAKIERSLDFANKLFNDLEYINDKYDYIIIESQHLYLKYVMNGYQIDKLIYWCPVCATNEKTRDFLEPFKELDRFIFSIANKVIVASNDQVKYFQSITGKNPIQITSLIDRNIECFKYELDKNAIDILNKYNYCKKIFLPFRLTDMGYKTQEIVDYLFENKDIIKDFIVLYSNPNNCDIKRFSNGNIDKEKFINNYFIQVPKNRDSYYTFIDKGEVIIPYFEDIEFICHAAIDEFKYGNCIVCKTIEEFKNILIK